MFNKFTRVRIDSWSAWLKRKDTHFLTDPNGIRPVEAPDITFLPINLRKRLSLESKIGLWLANHTLCQRSYARDALLSVFASRYGEYRRTYSILYGLSKGEAPTPAAFSSSVHNTTSGLWSIAAKSMAPSTTVSAGDATLQMGLFEAADTARESRGPVLFVYSDVPLPERYGSQDRIGAPTGFAAVLYADGEKDASIPAPDLPADRDYIQTASANDQVAALVNFLGSPSACVPSQERMTGELGSA